MYMYVHVFACLSGYSNYNFLDKISMQIAIFPDL